MLEVSTFGFTGSEAINDAIEYGLEATELAMVTLLHAH
jgi:hypothetical protein